MRKSLLTALVCLALQGSAQVMDSLEIHSVEWIFPGTRGEIASQEFQKIRSNINFGEFLAAPSGSYNWTGDFRSSTMGFAFKVVSRKKHLEKHSLLLVLRKQVVNLDWYTGSSDTLQLNLTGRYEYFQMGIGYDYRSINTKFLKLLSGVRFDLGLPVSGFHTASDAIDTQFISEGAITLTATVNLVAEVRLFKKTYFKFGPQWAIGHYQFDGLSTWVPQSGLISGFKFGL